MEETRRLLIRGLGGLLFGVRALVGLDGNIRVGVLFSDPPRELLNTRPATPLPNAYPITATKGHGNPFRPGGHNGGTSTVDEYVTRL